MSKRAALYIRVSSDEQARHGLSLGEQRADLLKYAEAHGYAVVDVYADEGATARKAIKQRKELQRLLADVADGRIDVIVNKCLDRWSRNIADFYETQKFLEAHDVVWECTQEKYNTTTASGRLHMNIRMSIAQDESDRTSERIKYVFAGKKERREVISGSIPFGYVITNKHLVENEYAPAVLFMFQHIASGGSARSLPPIIYEKYGVKISYRTVYDSLRNRVYIGEQYGISDYCPAIVPYTLFQQVQELIARNLKRAPTGRIYLFTGLVQCPDCGRTLTGFRGQKNAKGEYVSFEYKCNARIVNTKLDRCHFSRVISEKRIERYLLENIQSLYSDHCHVVELERAKKQKDNPEAKLSEVRERLLRLKDIYLDGMIDKAVYEADYVKLKQKEAELSVLIDKTPTVRTAAWQVVESSNFQETYQSLSRENKRRFWQSLISRITFEDTPESRGRNGVICFRVQFR